MPRSRITRGFEARENRSFGMGGDFAHGGQNLGIHGVAHRPPGAKMFCIKADVNGACTERL
jgi:hypothetical protein